MEITESVYTADAASARVAAYSGNQTCFDARAIPPSPGDPRLDGRPWRVVSRWPYDGRPAGVDGVALL